MKTLSSRTCFGIFFEMLKLVQHDESAASSFIKLIHYNYMTTHVTLNIFQDSLLNPKSNPELLGILKTVQELG
jgi:hypothetical protein